MLFKISALQYCQHKAKILAAQTEIPMTAFVSKDRCSKLLEHKTVLTASKLDFPKKQRQGKSLNSYEKQPITSLLPDF